MRVRVLAALAGVLALAACGSPAPVTSPAPHSPAASATRQAGPASASPGGTAGSQAAGLPPAPAHTVIVMLENHGYGEVIGSPQAPFLNRLARHGALFTDSRAVTHPSEPNYLALFSGSTQGVTGDGCPQHFTGPNLASELLGAGYTFTGYAEASKVPPEWHGWLHHTFVEPPTVEPFLIKAWEKPHLPNLTGTIHAYRPQGSLARGGERQKATGDYEAWTPK